MIAAYGEQLLEWLETYTFPTERRFADPDYAALMAEAFVAELLRNGTTTAVTLCSVHPESVDALGRVAERVNLRLVLGKVLMDRNAPPELCDTPERAYHESKQLIERWHERGRLLYAITPRFAPTSSPAQLRVAAELWNEHRSTYLHTHLSENRAEIEWVKSLFSEHESYTAVYDHFGLVTERSIFAHAIHLSEPELALLHERGATVAFCPSANLFLGSGLFPYRAMREAGVRVAIGTDVGAGTSFSLLRTLSEAYKVLQLQGERLSAHQGAYLATLGGARALRLDGWIGNFEPGKEADFVVLDFDSTPLLRLRCAAAAELDERLFALMMLGDDRAVLRTYVAGVMVHARHSGA
jgi:guanine deaminase